MGEKKKGHIPFAFFCGILIAYVSKELYKYCAFLMDSDLLQSVGELSWYKCEPEVILKDLLCQLFLVLE